MQGYVRKSVEKEDRPVIRLLGRLGICILALASAGWTGRGIIKTSEHQGEGWVIVVDLNELDPSGHWAGTGGSRERRSIRKGRPFALCDGAKVAQEGERACAAGSFNFADGRGALDLEALSEEVTEWCLAINGNLSECKPVYHLHYVIVAHRAAALRDAGHLLEAAVKFRSAASLAAQAHKRQWSFSYSNQSEEYYSNTARAIETEYLKSTSRRVDELVENGDLDAAIRLLKRAAEVAVRVGDGHRYTERAELLEKVRSRQKAQLAELEECQLLGEAERVLTKGRDGQRVWFCRGNLGIGDAVAVSDGIELLGTFTFDFSERYHWLGKATLANVTGTPSPELLVEIEIGVNEMEGDPRRQDAGVYGWPDGETFERLWRFDDRYDSVEWEDIDWWPDEKTALLSPTPKIANSGFTLEGVPMLWDDASRQFLPAESQRPHLREHQLQLARILLKQGKPWAAYLALPDGAPSDLTSRVEAACERTYLTALRKAQARQDELAEAWGDPELQALQVDMLDRGLECAPQSTSLRKRRDTLVARIESEQARAAQAEYEAARLARFENQEAGPFQFGMTHAQAMTACLRIGGRWDGGSGKLVACDVQIMPDEWGTFAAGFCGARACSLYYQARALGEEWTFYQNDLRTLTDRYGPGKSRKHGAGTVTEWRLGPKQLIRVTLTHDHGRGRYSIAMHLNGER